MPQIRYASYLFSRDFYVRIEKGKDSCSVHFSPKEGVKSRSIKREFFAELEDEKFRSGLFDSNKDLREYLVKSALVYKPSVPDPQEGLTKEEEEELDRIIAEVESELKKEKEDPLEIKKTWEERYGSKNKRK